MKRAVLVLAVGVVCSTRVLGDTEEASTAGALKNLSLEQLMNEEVVLVSRTPEKLTESPSAVQVLMGDEIRRSSAMTLPEALRLIPNLQVAQQNAHDWAITARGFNGAPLETNSLANKLLVMVDGRSVYTPLIGGVFWDVQNVLLEDIDRIEVVSGPGGTLWGANAVNGVINVVTKSARDTQGTYISGAGGSFLQDFGAVRYGGSVGTNLFYRVYVQRFDHNESLLANGQPAADSLDMTQGGFRTDYYTGNGTQFTLQGDFYSGSEGVPVLTFVDGQNILGRLTRELTENSDIKCQVYADRTWRVQPGSGFADELRTYDFDLQHHFPLGQRNDLLWGGEYRVWDDDVHNSGALGFNPTTRNLQLFSGFLQDEVTLWPDSVKLTLGTKVEHNDYTGFEVEPSARLAWMPEKRHTVWAAVSRAVRSPTRLDVDIAAPSISNPNHDFESEKLIAYELGYRVRPVDRLSLSFAVFYHDYDDLRSIDVNSAPPPPAIFANNQRANSWGAELSGTFQVLESWRLRGGYTYFDKSIWSKTSAVLPSAAAFEATDPRHQLLLHSILDLPWQVQLDVVGRYVSALPASSLPTPAVPDYLTADVRLAWQYRQFEVALVGQNLFDDKHPEFGAQQLPRAVYGKVTARF